MAEALGKEKFFNAKQAAIRNLEKLGMATVVGTTIVRGVNEENLVDSLEYAWDHAHVSELSVNGMAWAGDAKTGMDRSRMIMPDELMDLLHRRYFSSGREDVYTFQKLMIAAIQASGINLCYFTQMMVFVRGRNGLAPLTDFLAMRRMAAALRWWEGLTGAPRALRTLALLWVFLRSIGWRTFPILPALVPRSELTEAAGVNTLQFVTGQMVGPVLAAVIIATAGVPWAFAINALTYLAPIASMVYLLRRGLGARDPATIGVRRAAGGAGSSAVSYVRQHTWVLALLLGVRVMSRTDPDPALLDAMVRPALALLDLPTDPPARGPR